MTLDTFLDTSVARANNKTAIVVGERRVSYAELDELSARLASSLLRLRLQSGDRVAICLENSVECVVAILAVWRAGGAVMLVNPSTKTEKLTRLLDHAEATFLIVPSVMLPSVSWMPASLASLRRIVVVSTEIASPTFGADVVSFAALLERGSPSPPPRSHTKDSLAALLYTSGSSGFPKGVMHTHSTLTSVTKSITTYLESSAEDVILQVLPLSFGYGLTQLLTSLAVGATLVLERSITFPHLTLQRLERERATGFAIVPTIAALLDQMDLSTHDLSSLRYLTNAGAALPPELLRSLTAKIPRARFFPMYGQTECIRVTYLPPEEVARRPSSVGRGMPIQELWLVDEEGRRLPPGNTGELVVSGPHVMKGYWKLPEETQRKIKHGVHPDVRELRTGDIFHMDKAGWLTFVHRSDDIIKTRGEKVSPKEIEEVIALLEDVLEVAVVGLPDPVLGQIVKAFVAPRLGARLDARLIQRHCAERLEDFSVPRVVEIIDTLPKNPNGKIDKQALLEEKQ